MVFGSTWFIEIVYIDWAQRTILEDETVLTEFKDEVDWVENVLRAAGGCSMVLDLLILRYNKWFYLVSISSICSKKEDMSKWFMSKFSVIG